MEKKRYLLTNFDKKRWNGIDMESVRNQVDKIKGKDNIFGEMSPKRIVVGFQYRLYWYRCFIIRIFISRSSDYVWYRSGILR